MYIIRMASNWAIPVLILAIFLYGLWRGINIYDVFVAGAAEGINIVIRIIPYLTAMIVAINIFTTSGALDYLLYGLEPVFDYLHIPLPVAPLLFLRPLSGNASLAYINNIFQEYGPDSFIGKLASTVQGSTETTLYIIAVYFGAIGIKKQRYSLWVGLIADAAGFFAAVFICNLLFS